MSSSVPRPPFQTARPPTSSRTSHRLAPELREAVWARCGGLCELCAERLQAGAWHAHHRKLTSRGGLDSVTNLLALHTLCHNRVHGHVTWAENAGLMVASHDDPAKRPVALHGLTWALLLPDGSYLPRADGEPVA